MWRRLHHNAVVRNKSSKLEAHNFVQRQRCIEDMKAELRTAKEDMRASHADRMIRWSEKLAGNPLATDLWAEDQMTYERHRAAARAQSHKQIWMERRQQEAHSSILDRAGAEADELEQLRSEKRRLHENTRSLRAMKDVERTHARVAKIFSQRQQVELDRQQKLLAQAFSSPSL